MPTQQSDDDDIDMPDEELQGQEITITQTMPNQENKRPCPGGPPILSKKFRTQKRDEEEMSILKEIATSMNQKSGKQKDDESNECERFGQYVSKSLDKLDGKSRSICKNMIQNAIFQCEMGVPQSQISQHISASPPSSLHLSW